MFTMFDIRMNENLVSLVVIQYRLLNKSLDIYVRYDIHNNICKVMNWGNW